MSTKRQMFLSVLQQHPDGISKEELKTVINTSDSAVYSMIYGLRRLQGCKITNHKGIYKLKSSPKTETEIVVHQTQQQFQTQQSVSPSKTQSTLPNGLTLKEMESVSRLSSSDKDDYYDMIKKSVFYKLSAEAILAANSVVDGFRRIH